MKMTMRWKEGMAALGLIGCLLALPVQAAVPALRPVPAYLPDAVRKPLEKQYADRQTQYADLAAMNEKFAKEFAGRDIPEGSAEAQRCHDALADLQTAEKEYTAAANQFNKDVDAAVAEEMSRVERAYLDHLDAAFAATGSFLHDALMTGASRAREKLDRLPTEAQSALDGWAVAKFNEGLSGEGLPPLTAGQAGQLSARFNTLLTAPCRTLGIAMCDQLQSGIQEAAAQPDAGALFEKMQLAEIGLKPQTEMNFVLTVGAGAYTLNSKGQVGIKYNTGQFISFIKTGQTRTLIEPLTTNLNKVTIDLAKTTANWSADVSGTWTFCNDAGQLNCPWNVRASATWKW
jgi:hypothetical protein